MTHRPDAVTSKDQGGNFECHSDGQHAVYCVDVVDMGPKVEQFQDFPPKEVAKVALVYASGERNDDGSLRIVTTEVTNSMGERARLRAHLEAWRGKSYTPEQVEAGVPLHKLHGQPALISIEHVTTKKKRKFAALKTIMPLPRGMTPPDRVIIEEYTRPEFFAKRKEEYAQAVAKFRAEAYGDDEPPPGTPPEDDPDDDLPF